jgi:hypothetical protein
MALMSLYQNGSNPRDIATNISPIKQSHYFTISVVGESLMNEEANYDSDFVIQGIMDSLPAISYQTSWDTSPVSVITENIKSFTDNDAIRKFAQNNRTYRPPIITDGWTQLMPKDGCALSISLAFKAYPTLMYSTTDFRSILNFLFFVTTPREYYISDSAKYIKSGLEQSYIKGRGFGTLLNQAHKDYQNIAESDNANTSFVKLAKYTVATPKQKTQAYNELNAAEKALAEELDAIKSFFDDLLSTADKNVGGVPLCELTIKGLINKVDTVRWLVKNWSFKPCINTTREFGVELPLFVEFKIDLETQTILSNNDIRGLLGS